jgi:type I restriction enzyme M protein
MASAITFVNELPTSTHDERRALALILQELVQDSSFRRYYTPRPIADLAVQFLQPKLGDKIYDPCFSSGVFLGEAAEFIRQKTSNLSISQLRTLQSKTFFGKEASKIGFITGWLTLISNGILKPSLSLDGTKEITSFEFTHELFDVIIASPPFGKRLNTSSEMPFQPRESELFFLMHIAMCLKRGGRAAVILPEGTLFRGGKYRKIRRWLSERYDVHTVVSLPANNSSSKRSIRKSLICFANTGPTRNVWFYNLENIDSGHYLKPSSVELNDIPDCLEKWRDSIDSEKSHLFSVDKISKNEYRLTLPSLLSRDKVERYFKAISPVIPIVQLGSMPDEIRILSGISDFRRTAVSKDKSRERETIPLLTVADIERGTIKQPELSIPLEGVPKNKLRSALRPGDLLLSIRGTIGKMAICRKKFTGAMYSNGLLLIRCGKKVLPEYLFHYFHSDIGRAQIEMISLGSHVPYMTISDFKKLKIPLPPLDIQQRVISGLELFTFDKFGQKPLFEKSELDDSLQVLDTRLIKDVDRDSEWLLLHNQALNWLATCDRPSTGRTHLEQWWRTQLYSDLRDLRNKIVHTDFIDKAFSQIAVSVDTLWKAIELMNEARKVTGSETLLILERARSTLGSADKGLSPEMQPRIYDVLTTAIKGAHKLIDLETERLLPKTRLNISCLSEVLPTETTTDLRLQIRNSTEFTVTDVCVTLFLAKGSDRVDIKKGETRKISQIGGHDDEILKWEVGPLFSLSDEYASAEIEESLPFKEDLIIEFDLLEVPSYAPPIENPYVPGGALYSKEMFKGREDIFEFLYKNLIGAHQNNVVVFQGSRKMGKSSILMQIEKHNRLPNCIPVYIDCQGLGELDEQLLFYKIARSIGKALRSAGIPIKVPPRKQFSKDDSFYDFRELIEDYETQLDDRKILIMLDEFEYIDFYIQNDKLPERILENFRHLFQHHRSLAVILTGSHRLSELREEYWSVLFAVGLYKEIDVLDETSARELISAPLAGIVRYTPDAVDEIIRLTSCHPYFIQMLCHTIVEKLYGPSSVSSRMVEEALSTVMERAQEQLNHMMAQATTPRRQIILIRLAERLDKDEPTTLMDLEGVLIEDGVSFTGRELEADLKALREAQFLTIEKRGYERFYSFKVELFRRWLLENFDPAVIAKRAREDI